MFSFADQTLLANLLVMLLSYIYIISMIFVSNRIAKILMWSQETSCKVLHILIGNLSFILPFFTESIFPVMVAAPFVLVTFLVSPYSPIRSLKSLPFGLQDTTEKGHPLGLVFYSISYTVLAALFFSTPYVVAAGILPMAYGDGVASLIGEHYGRRKYKILSQKSLEGSLAVFTGSFVSLLFGLVFYSLFFQFSAVEMISLSLWTALIATLVEAISPLGFDNLTVPLICALSFSLIRGR
ncbi:MAG: SEC59/DGK1/VTE5 family protein [Candidatus Bathyarchaeota archaeon]|nr:SEC59/DGK1/VTE5 family protein [Candidatus Bathyarchaeota archaeon]